MHHGRVHYSLALHLFTARQCSAECGRGQRTRQAVCVDVNDVPLQDAKCQHLRQPRVVEVCDMGSCARTWFFTEWTPDVSNLYFFGIFVAHFSVRK